MNSPNLSKRQTEEKAVNQLLGRILNEKAMRTTLHQKKPARAEDGQHLLRIGELEQEIAILHVTDTIFSNLMNHMFDCMISVTSDGKIAFVNRQIEQNFGYKAPELIGKSAEILIPKRFLRYCTEHRDKYFQNPVPQLIGAPHELAGRRKDGSEFPVEVSLSPCHIFGGTLVTALVRDISERKRLEKQREKLANLERKAREEAERANQIKDAFLATLSHELRTPITAILSWAQLIRATKLKSKKVRRGIDIIERAKFQNELIDELLDLARIRAGKIVLKASAIDPSEIIKLAVESVRPLAENKQLRIVTDLKIKGEKVWADASRLQQVVWNLLTNAIKFSTNGGEIQVRARKVRRHGAPLIAVQVIDQGRGIAPQFLPRLFKRFSQAESGPTQTYSGLGLGLFIVHDLLRMLGGKVIAESKGLGKGASFTVLLPAMTKKAGKPGPRLFPLQKRRKNGV